MPRRNAGGSWRYFSINYNFGCFQTVVQGDLTQRVRGDSNNELARLSRSFHAVLEKQRAIIAKITSKSRSMDRSATELSRIAAQMSVGAEDISTRTGRVSGASKEVSSNLRAADLRQMALELTTIAKSFKI